MARCQTTEGDLQLISELQCLPVHPRESTAPTASDEDMLPPAWLSDYVFGGTSLLSRITSLRKTNTSTNGQNSVDGDFIRFLRTLSHMNTLCHESDDEKQIRTSRCTGLIPLSGVASSSVDQNGYEVSDASRKKRASLNLTTLNKHKAAQKQFSFLKESLNTHEEYAAIHRAWCQSLLLCGLHRVSVYCDAVVIPLWKEIEVASTTNTFSTMLSSPLEIAKAIRFVEHRKKEKEAKETDEKLAIAEANMNRRHNNNDDKTLGKQKKTTSESYTMTTLNEDTLIFTL